MGNIIRTIIMGFIKFIKKQTAYLALAMAGVEKNAFGQKGDDLDVSVNQERRHTQGTLMDSLKQGEVTQEVINLRWRMYKIINESANLVSDITGYDENGLPITKTRKINRKESVKKVKPDSFDTYPVEMVLDNSPITVGIETDIKTLATPTLNYDNNNIVTGATHGNISSEEYGLNKQELPISISRTITPRFELETYTKKLIIRTINETDKLLEFYVSKYPDDYNRTTRLFISDIKKIIENPRGSTTLEIDEVDFITHKTLGSDDFKLYHYKVKSFDKIIEFNGFYVIKFICETIINGEDIFENYRVADLDDKYERKERKKQ